MNKGTLKFSFTEEPAKKGRFTLHNNKIVKIINVQGDIVTIKNILNVYENDYILEDIVFSKCIKFYLETGDKNVSLLYTCYDLASWYINNNINEVIYDDLRVHNHISEGEIILYNNKEMYLFEIKNNKMKNIYILQDYKGKKIYVNKRRNITKLEFDKRKIAKLRVFYEISY